LRPKEDLLALFLALLLIVITIGAASAAPQWMYQGF
jgi:hypothetical protein